MNRLVPVLCLIFRFSLKRKETSIIPLYLHLKSAQITHLKYARILGEDNIPDIKDRESSRILFLTMQSSPTRFLSPPRIIFPLSTYTSLLDQQHQQDPLSRNWRTPCFGNYSLSPLNIHTEHSTGWTSESRGFFLDNRRIASWEGIGNKPVI